MGFDGIDVGKLIQPSLTTISQPSRRMGRVAVQLLLDRLEGGQETLRLMPFKFRPGESVTRMKQTEVKISH
jgi:DNA-binding LacI/PurR family transcriptional regulator